MELPANYNCLSTKERKIAREKYIAQQNGLCAYCKKPLTGKSANVYLSKKIERSLFPENFFKYPIHLQHNHETGLTEGAVHAWCNAIMWQYEGR